MELKELQKMKVDQLRAEAAKLEGVEGISSMKKQELIDLLCEKLDIQRPEARSEEKAEDTPPTADTASEEKAEAKAESPAEEAKETKPKPKVAEKKGSVFKARLKVLQAKRKQAIADRDYQTLADVRTRIKKYKRKIRKESASSSPS